MNQKPITDERESGIDRFLIALLSILETGLWLTCLFGLVWIARKVFA